MPTSLRESSAGDTKGAAHTAQSKLPWTRPLSSPCRMVCGQGRVGEGEASGVRTGQKDGGPGTDGTLPGLCTLWGGPGPPPRRHTISLDSQLRSQAALLSGRWQSSHSPGKRQTGEARTDKHKHWTLSWNLNQRRPPPTYTHTLPAKARSVPFHSNIISADPQNTQVVPYVYTRL